MNKVKITLLTILTTAAMTISSFAIEVKVGISGGYSMIEASGTETLKDTSGAVNHTEQAIAVIPSIFLEVGLDNGLAIGVDSVSGSADLAGSNRTRNLDTGGSGDDSGTNVANAEVDGITTVYLIKQFKSGFLVKAGTASADINTKETLSSGTAYGNKSVDGSMFGIGYQMITDSGLFFRTTVENTDFDTINLTGSQVGGTASSFNKIKADVDVTMAKFSIGKSF